MTRKTVSIASTTEKPIREREAKHEVQEPFQVLLPGVTKPKVLRTITHCQGRLIIDSEFFRTSVSFVREELPAALKSKRKTKGVEVKQFLYRMPVGVRFVSIMIHCSALRVPTEDVA